MLFVIQFVPRRKDLLTTMTEEEQAAIGRHFEQLQRLEQAGSLLLAGRRDDGAFGIAVVRCGSEVDARRIVESDAAVRAGVFEGTVGSFRVSLGGFGEGRE